MAASGSKTVTKARKIVKARKSTRFSTPHSRNHRFQSFSERISSLKIDPIRRKRHVEDNEELSSQTESYFGRALTEWRDRNLSQTFVAFASEVEPLCDGLPMVLHNEDRIMSRLALYIKKADALAMEPLLSLLSHFAHDLDVRFEKHFELAVDTVASVAAAHSDFEVIEHSFTCLAWLFKYLSRLLVADLRPLYDLMGPYLGRQTSKPFIIRFTAESLAFLIRKAASLYIKDTAPLDIIVDHMLVQAGSIEDSTASDLYQQGVMTLLSEAVKGVQNSVNSAGPAIVQSLLKSLDNSAVKPDTASMLIVSGLLTSVIHHTTQQSFVPIEEVILSHYARELQLKVKSLDHIRTVLLTIIAVRKGNRISDWSKVMSLLQIMATRHQASSCDELALVRYTGLVAITFSTAPMEAILPSLGLLDTLRSQPFQSQFLRVCEVVSRLDVQRFNSFLRAPLVKFCHDHWDEYLLDICQYLPKWRVRACQVEIKLKKPQQESLIHKLQSMMEQKSPDSIHIIASINYISLEIGLKEQLSALLCSAVLNDLTSEITSHPSCSDPLFGFYLNALLDIAVNQAKLEVIWNLLPQQSQRYIALPSFWRCVHRMIQQSPLLTITSAARDQLSQSAVKALSLASHDIRESALEILKWSYDREHLETPDTFATAITIESTPLTPEAERSISMNIRRLTSEYLRENADLLVNQAIPAYCFGMLHFKFRPARDDALNALSEMAKTSAGEEIVIDTVTRWLEGSSLPNHGAEVAPQILDGSTATVYAPSDFECTNAVRAAAILQQVFESSNSGYPSGQDMLTLESRRVPVLSQDARKQALQLLVKVPSIAEKRSRMLVPVLLRWAGNIDMTDSDNDQSACRWKREEQKLMLTVFSLFTNPKVLFKSSETYQALLNLTANGDVEIQKSALTALLAWKDTALIRYAEHLNNLLDEDRFREELSVFLQNDDGDDSITDEHRPQLMPVLLRLLYGRAVAGGKQDHASRRKAIFMALSSFGPDSLSLFVDIAMDRVCQFNASPPNTLAQIQLSAPPRQQSGLLNMMNDMLQVVGVEISSCAPKLASAVVACAAAASQRLEMASSEETIPDASMLRAIRQTGLSCIATIFDKLDAAVDLTVVAHMTRDSLVEPRLEKFSVENTESVSGMLRLMSAWSKSSRAISYLEDGVILKRLADLLKNSNTKHDVRIFILDHIVDPLFDHHAGTTILDNSVPDFVAAIGDLLLQTISKEMLASCVTTVSRLTGQISVKDQAESIIAVCSDLLIKPGKLVQPRTKLGLLRTIQPLIERFGVLEGNSLYTSVCGLFSRATESTTRIAASAVLLSMSDSDATIRECAQICAELNAPGSQLEELDSDRRMNAFERLIDAEASFTARQWLPLVHNYMFYIRDEVNSVNRAYAAQALNRFLNAADEEPSFKSIILEVILPGTEHGVRISSELVRAEFLAILGRLAKNPLGWPTMTDLKILTIDDDEEASIFNNILHIQQPRRLRALRRLADKADSLTSTNITRFFLPLLEHFIFDQAQNDAGRTLADQAILTISALAKSLNWQSFRAVFKRYSGYIATKEDLEKTVLRLLGALIDGLDAASAENEQMSRDEKSARRANTITNEFLPGLLEYLHKKDESTVDRRMPVAVSVIKLLQLLPDDELTNRLPPVLTDISHVLRSRSQEARDQTRKTLATILSLIGPVYLKFMVKELKSALQRGYQLHVLSFTVHSLLLQVVDTCQPGDLDSCLPELMDVVMNDIFGTAGQEKDAEEYKSIMKEVKARSSYDTMQILARATPVEKLGMLVAPLRSLLAEKLDSKTVRKVDELLTRLRAGIDQNPGADSREMLAFCHELMRQGYAGEVAEVKHEITSDYKTRKFLIQMESANKSKSRGATTSQLFKVTVFALNLMRTVIRRHADLQTPANMAGFLPMIGDALVQSQQDVKLAAMRVLATIIKTPLDELDSNAPVYLREAVDLIKASNKVNTDSSKAALELVTAILREKRDFEVRKTDIGLLLKSIKADIDEPDRQGLTYRFLRAVLGRKVVIVEVYELMDEVAKVMVVNGDRTTRESARSTYVQFVMDYPQSEERWKKQVKFLVDNLKYEHASGRQSVLEALHQVLGKLGDETLSKVALTFFAALVIVRHGDIDGSCRQMAGVLLTKLFERASDERRAEFLDHMEKWLSWDSRPSYQRAALNCWEIYLRTDDVEQNRVAKLRDEICRLLDSPKVQVETGMLQNILTVVTTMMEVHPEIIYAKTSATIWSTVQQCLQIEDDSIQVGACALTNAFFTHLASSSVKAGRGLESLPLKGSGGLEITFDDMKRTCLTCLHVLKKARKDIHETLIPGTARILVFLGRCFAVNKSVWHGDDVNDDDAEEEQDEEDHGDDDDEQPAEDRLRYQTSAIEYLLNRLSYLIRQDTVTSAARTAAIQCENALISNIGSVPSLHIVIRSLYLLTDPSVAHSDSEEHRALQDRARELLDTIQKLLGSSAYLAALAEARKSVRGKRDERRQKRKIAAVAAPEKWAQSKKRKHEAHKTRKKEKGAEARGRRRGW